MSGLNPQELFGGKFRIKIDPANEKHRNIDPMYFVIPCQYGEIYPFSDDKLALMVTSIKVAKRLRREHPELKVHQDADDAVVFLFPLNQFDLVAGYVHPRRKRQLSPEHHELLRQVGFGGRTPEDSGFKRTVKGTSELTTRRSGVR